MKYSLAVSVCQPSRRVTLYLPKVSGTGAEPGEFSLASSRCWVPATLKESILFPDNCSERDRQPMGDFYHTVKYVSKDQ